MTNSFLTKVFGTDSHREIKALRPVVAAINDLEPGMQKLSDLSLAAKSVEFKQRLAKGSTLDDLLVEAFAVVREAGRRVLNMRHYDVQLIGGILLHRCRVVEIATGEGRTLVASAPAYLNALSGKGVHAVTLNDYLAQRDALWMGRIYTFLGLTVGFIAPDHDADERRQSYGADITYSTSAQLAFDYLRDNMKFDLADCVQRGSNFAVVDEVDSILIDDARTPIVISGEGEESTDKYWKINRCIPKLVRGAVIEGKKPEQRKATGDYTLDDKNETAELTDEGVLKVQRLLGFEDLTNEYKHLVRNALRAHNFFRRDREYVVRDGHEGPEVVIVDKPSGRLMEGSKWSKGLHQAIEAKEGVLVHPESATLAAISVQNYFRLYKGLAGMSGTVALLAGEFREVYRLPVITVPRNSPSLRQTSNDVIYRTETEKWRNAAKDIQERNRTGQPVLAGVTAADKLGAFSAVLKKMGVRHTVLSTGSVEESRRVFARAGRSKEVTLCTLTAARGLNIICGGDPEYMAQEECRRQNLAEALTTSETPPDPQAWHYFADGSLSTYRVPVTVWGEVFARHEAECRREREDVARLGGLCVIALDRQWERRLDERFSQRGGLQGDPGTYRFILCLQDDLLTVFGGQRMQNLMLSLGMEEDVPIESGLITRRIRQAQKANEERFFGQRTHMLKYDDVLNQQREAVYGMRRELLEGLDQKEGVNEMTRSAVDRFVDARCPRNAPPSAWDLTGIQADMLSHFGAHLNELQMDGLRITAQVGTAQLKNSLFENARQIYRAKEDLFGADVMRQTERVVMLQVIDNHWKEHLRAMDNLEGGIDMRSFGTTQMVEEATQGVASLLVGGIAGALVRRNRPLADFREKATALFDEMTRQINEETVSHLFHLEVNSQSEEEDEAEKEDEDEEDEEEDEDDEDEEDEESVSERPGFVSQAATASPVLPQPAAQINPANKPPYLCRANSAPGEPSEMRGDEQLRGRKAGFLGGHLKRTLSGHSGRVRWLMMSPDCRQVSSGSDDRTIRVWDIGTGKCTRIIDPPNFLSELAISSDGHRLMAECGNCNFSDEHWLAVWETSTGKLTKFVKAFKNEDVIAMSADSLTTLSAGVFEPIRLWDVMGGKCLQTLEGKWCHTNYGAFVADGSWVITADDKIKLWEVKSGKCRKAITGHGPLSISTDGALVAFTGQDYNTIRIWNIVEDVPVSTLMGHTGQVMSVVLSLDQRWVLSGSEERNSATKDGMVRLWEVSSGACLATFEGRIANMGVVALSPDACLALASDEDHTIRVWELRWDWEFPASEDWDEGARPHLVNFLTLHTPFVSTDPDSREFLVRRGRPSWQESEQRLLLRSLQCAGYGWLKPEGVIRELEQMAADWEAPPPSPWEERN